MSELIPVTEKFNARRSAYELECGNKFLDLFVPTTTDEPVFTTEIVSVGSNLIPGGTSALHIRAAQLMQGVTDRMGQPITYEFAVGPEAPRLVAWARTYGGQIFDWAVEADGSRGEFRAEKVFTPIPGADAFPSEMQA